MKELRTTRMVAVAGGLFLLVASGVRAASLDFYDIVPYAPGREAETARDIRAAHAKTGLETFLYSVTLDPRGRPAFDNVRAATASYRRLKAELGDAPVRLGFLLQAILGHWARVDREIEPWQRTVNVEGVTKRFCVLDARFQDYIRQTAAALAAEHPCFILGDDDIRAYSPKLECFCPLHTAEFNRRTGRNLTPEAYRAAVKACQPGDIVWKTCSDLRTEVSLTVARLLREGIDSVDPAIPAGACTPGAELLQAAPRAKILAGKGNPSTLRLPNGKYAEIYPGDLINYVLYTQYYIDHYRADIDRLLDESDTCPHTLYARSERTFATKLALGIFEGLRGAKIWYVGMHKSPDERVPEAHDRALGNNRHLFESLAKALDGSVPVGLRIPAFRCPAPLRRAPLKFFAESRWNDKVLGVYGIPFRVDFSRAPGEPVLLGGDKTVGLFAKDELDELLRGRVLVDGAAALALAAGGRSAAIGCTPVADDRPFNIEQVCATGSRPPMAKSPNVPALTDLAPGARTLSEFRFAQNGARAVQTDFVAAASICYTNAAGGTILTASYDVDNHYTVQSPRRKAALVAALRALDPSFPVVCENFEPVLAQARRGADGRLYVFVANLGYDDLSELRFSLAGVRGQPELLGADGAWHAANATCAGGVCTIPHRTPPMDFAVVRW